MWHHGGLAPGKGHTGRMLACPFSVQAHGTGKVIRVKLISWSHMEIKQVSSALFFRSGACLRSHRAAPCCLFRGGFKSPSLTILHPLHKILFPLPIIALLPPWQYLPVQIQLPKWSLIFSSPAFLISSISSTVVSYSSTFPLNAQAHNLSTIASLHSSGHVLCLSPPVSEHLKI